MDRDHRDVVKWRRIVDMMKQLVSNIENVSLHSWDGLIVDFAEKMGIRVILRGVRALSDFNYEFELSLLNTSLNSHIETKSILSFGHLR